MCVACVVCFVTFYPVGLCLWCAPFTMVFFLYIVFSSPLSFHHTAHASKLSFFFFLVSLISMSTSLSPLHIVRSCISASESCCTKYYCRFGFICRTIFVSYKSALTSAVLVSSVRALQPTTSHRFFFSQAKRQFNFFWITVDIYWRIEFGKK